MHKHPEDPIRFPKIQKKLEKQIKDNFESVVSVILTEVTKVLGKDVH